MHMDDAFDHNNNNNNNNKGMTRRERSLFLQKAESVKMANHVSKEASLSASGTQEGTDREWENRARKRNVAFYYGYVGTDYQVSTKYTQNFIRETERERGRESHREVSGSTPAGREESLADACAPFLVCLFWELDSCGVGRET